MIINSPVWARSALGPAGAPPPVGDTLLSSTITPFTSNLGNGRIGFYIDYSELSTLGTLNFAVERTHGTAGAVSADYDIYDEDGTTVLASGTLNWAAGNADKKIISATISSKASGTYRNHAHLTNVTGGAVLNFGVNTKAFGVIDDGTIAADSDAVFFNSAAAGGGDGSQATPYNNVYTAISTLNSSGKKRLYLRGTITPDGTNTGHPYGESVHSITGPTTRTSEATRSYVENWPGFTCTITGSGGSNKFGFLAPTNASYQTWRGLDFTDISCSGVSNADCGGIWYHYGTSTNINVELCNFTGIDGATGTNSGGANLYGAQGWVWRCTAGDITLAGSANGNTAGVYTYDGDGISVQRCHFTSTVSAPLSRGIYQKRTASGFVSINAKFNIFDECYAYYGISGGSNLGHFGMNVSNNFFTGTTACIRHITDVAALATGRNVISNNYFYNSDTGDEGAIQQHGFADAQVFGNVFESCAYCWTDDRTGTDDNPIYFDYNVNYNNSNFAHINYVAKTPAQFNTDAGSVFTLCANQQTANPNATDPANGDVTLGGSSSATAANIDGNDCGVYLTGIEKLGPVGLVVFV